MATLFKPSRSFPLPPNAVIIEKGGKPHVGIRDRGRLTFYPLTVDGTKYLKPSGKWAADVCFANGTRKRVRFSTNREAAAVMLADLLKRIENEKAGFRDPFADHRNRPLSAHLEDWKASLEASGRGEEYVALKLTRVRAALDGCEFLMPPDLSADRLETFLHKLRVEGGRSVQTSNDWLQTVSRHAQD